MDKQLNKSLQEVLTEVRDRLDSAPVVLPQYKNYKEVTSKLSGILDSDISYTDYMNKIQDLYRNKMVVNKLYSSIFNKSKQAYRMYKKDKK